MFGNTGKAIDIDLTKYRILDISYDLAPPGFTSEGKPFEPVPGTFPISVAATVTALVLLGLLRWRVTDASLVRSVGETVLIGGVCAVIAYLVGTAFR